MATTTSHVDGLRALGESMRLLKREVAQRGARSATAAGAGVVKKATKSRIQSNPSIETGSMRDAVIAKRVPASQTNLTSEHIVTFRGRGKPYNKKGQRIDRAPHAHLVEFGTVNMPAEPSLRPALEENQEAVIAAMAKSLKKVVDKAGKA